MDDILKKPLGTVFKQFSIIELMDDISLEGFCMKINHQYNLTVEPIFEEVFGICCKRPEIYKDLLETISCTSEQYMQLLHFC